MKQEIIDKICGEVENNRYRQKKIENIEAYLKGYDGSFMILIFNYDVDVLKINKELFRFASVDTMRIMVFRDIRYALQSFTYYGENYPDARCFFYNGYELKKYSYEEAKRIVCSFLEPYIDYLRELHPEENKACKKRIPIRFHCPLSYVKECLKKAEELGDSSLLDCLKQKRNYSRVAVHQYIEVGRDFAPYSFTFCDIHAHEDRTVYGINGGIIYSGYSDSNRWSSHT